MTNCVFCKIIAKEIPAQIVHEDEFCIGFNDIHPKAPVHLLLVPKKHIPTLSDIDDHEEQLVGHMIKIAKEIAHKEKCEGYRLVFNVNEKGGQEVFHLHMHLMGWK
ncbi:MAG: histidine triad (HIT) protein, Hit-like protein involved in cell-cycle regulation [Candidatus Peregrinibacteria bacterium GW2011_GWF2_33_10]|nr:MAG: histidine triad (HIT) protein, Hit-like protein involved in cell-cycle regulation [Candidatus Peregrinibacteria bacterium GW2011_GWF2_33_10]OGJ44082.1 MAG: histidine triad nucleotide-binding protein [Candidatus Peregrinibacteria bacterium RIFOXYA2_FULL_33_21]OGJ45728.1 MAG: histidine triad nucleotide-binding protein [Candidatus Peregrinibacteria bacterium RIFOXYA12_FULL_33_12]OGJ51393.1 MAG: histidine triad nucleotide-binding protein [Candidatus Peregrinibacteria bacterium RIFOXYB2_FULL_